MSEEKLSAFHLALYEQAGYRSMTLLYPAEAHFVRVLINPDTSRMRVDVLPPGEYFEPHSRKNGCRLVHWYKEERLKKAIRDLVLEHHRSSHDEPWSAWFDEDNCRVKGT